MKKLGIVSKPVQWMCIIPFTVVLCTVFADSTVLANGNVSAKHFWFYASMALMLPVIPFLKPVKRYHAADLLVLLLGASILVASLSSGVPLAKTKLILLALLLVLYFQLRNLISNYRSIEMLFTTILLFTAFVECIVGLSQLYGFSPSNHGIFNITGTFFNPGPYSGYVGMFFPLALYRTLLFTKTESHLRHLIAMQYTEAKQYFKTLHDSQTMATSKVLKLSVLNPRNQNSLTRKVLSNPSLWIEYLLGYLSMATVIASLLVLPSAMSRASWVGLIVGSMWVLLHHKPIRTSIHGFCNTKTKRILATSLLTSLLCGAGFGMYALKPASADGRLLLWKSTLRTMVEHPLGVGLGKFGNAVGKTQASYFESGKASQAEIDRANGPFYAFNEYLQIGVESGIQTLILFLCLLALAFRNAYRQGMYGFSGALISLLFFAFFSYPFSVLPFLIALVFLLALCNTDNQKQPVAPIALEDYTTRVASPLKKNIPALTSILSLVLITGCLMDRYSTYKAWREWGSCKLILGAELYKDAADDLKPLYPALNDNPEYLFDFARALSGAKYYRESNQVLVRTMSFISDPMLYIIYGKNAQALKEFGKAEAAFKMAYNLVPNRIYPLYRLSKLYAEGGKIVQAKQIAEKVFNHRIIVPSKAIEEMKDSLKLMLEAKPHILHNSLHRIL